MKYAQFLQNQFYFHWGLVRDMSDAKVEQDQRKVIEFLVNKHDFLSDLKLEKLVTCHQ